MKLKIFFLLLCCTWFGAQAQSLTGNVLIKNGTVLTVTKGTLENTDVLVKDGKITQIGKNLVAPAGYNVIDASGMHV
ncbi:MAG: amidohydrolase, partial [Chryseotalea sp.]